MIKSATQLKAKVRNVSGGDDKIAKAYMRIFFMERFIERVSLSKYKDNFILKGGLLVSSLLGVNVRATMDIDTTVKAISLTEEDATRIVEEICSLQLEDNVTFRVTNVETIMEDFEYPGIRIHMEALLEKLKQPIKIDISTDDVITPRAIEYEYGLMFEERSILLNSYNIETMLAEKAQTIINRSIANTRMRDFYDIYELTNNKEFSWETATEAFIATCCKREMKFDQAKIESVLNLVSESKDLEELWNNFKKKNYFVEDVRYAVMIESVVASIKRIANV